MRKLLGLMGLIGLMGIIPIGPIMSMNPIQAQDTSRLELCVETRQFFQDNEWFGLHATGYTLPGFYLRPKVAWHVSPGVTLEAGVHWLHFWGARNYPSGEALGVWQRESDTSSATHLLPWVRAEWKWTGGSVTMGCLRPHELPLPLYNPERLYAADPEAGVQLLLDYKHFDMDLWVDWREYIWQHSSRQEQFTAGLSGMLDFGDNDWSIKIPVHVIGQHVGGQGLAEHKPVQNRFNGAAGLFAKYKTIQAGFYAMAFTQKNMPTVLYKRGWGLYPTASVTVEPFNETALTIDAGYWQSHGFVPLLGSVLFSNVGYVDGVTYFGMNRMMNIGASCRWNMGGGELRVEGRWYYYFEKEKPSQYSVGVFIDLAPRLILVR